MKTKLTVKDTIEFLKKFSENATVWADKVLEGIVIEALNGDELAFIHNDGTFEINHLPYIQLYRAVNGWQTMHMVWDEGGFYDVANTGFGPYGHEKEGYDRAFLEGSRQAQIDGIEFKAASFEPLNEGDPKDLVECMTQICKEKGEKLTVVQL